MVWTVEYDVRAVKELSKLSRQVRTEIVDYMTSRIASAENPRGFGKALRHNKFGLWRYRVRDYRIVCELQDKRLVVLAVGVGHRREVYE
ncbi:type II toxin-antitoxin system RelE family toxin [Rhodopila sp.]|uniref:type II toxin-antitoxin system RelE family toxin n=1 Tax=Rhodopila sp. TaxID=2480087 RepID=UPI003D0AE07D